MHVVTAEEMRRIDFDTIQRIGIPALVLMENAGRAVAEEIIGMAPQVGRRWLILVGKGNNGADGLVTARHLLEAGVEATVVYTVDPASLTGDAAVQRDIAAKLQIQAMRYGIDTLDWRDYDGVVDGLLGTGSKGAPRHVYAKLIEQANASGLPIVAIDIPSGINADTGEINQPCIRATKTVALAFKKRGLLQFPGAECAGEVVVRPIGIPVGLADEHEVTTFELNDKALERKLAASSALRRAPDAHKGTAGHVLVAAGCRAYSGAGLLASTAALRGGSGLVTWAAPAALVPTLVGHQPELILVPVSDNGQGDWDGTSIQDLLKLITGKQALVVGPGMGRWNGDTEWLREVWESTTLPLVIDADALNMIADAPDFPEWRRREEATIMTPHPGEMARLAKLPTKEVQRDRIELTRRYAAEHGVTLVLKGARTVCATSHGEVYINVTGNAGMATGGSGDVLAGLIGSLLAQGCSAAQAAALGVYLHGAAGDRAAAKRPSTRSLIAGDIVDEL
ncbi:NAD(P)H-hydrate dehydratase [Paenibacillus cremeus]|uniref:Bifunctional NAD(P)H-hydrate repair enzyme n=1 Tax=Paenibacillus cremeus TaxID=2163881 RepID=A0A559KGT8_9BACL|nr:NAD(P)H-hydrate dehydratase [Paenibacillus cremeus]TVY11353.1 NAD(P)H-hydrate dehydratase [Paenibacillus cremeus]